MEEKTLKLIRSYAETGKYRRVPVSRELYADAFTPVEVMRCLRAASRHCYLLESAEDRQRWGRYSFLGYAPSMEITCTGGVLTIVRGKEEEEKERRRSGAGRGALKRRKRAGRAQYAGRPWAQ